MKKNDEGFTLIELLIVIVILGILAAVVVFAVGGITDQGQESSCKAERKTVEVAIEAYRAQEQAYPSGATPITSFLGAGGASWYEPNASTTDAGMTRTTEGQSACDMVDPNP